MTEAATRKALLILLFTFFGNFIINAQTIFQYRTSVYEWSVATTTTKTKVTLSDNELKVSTTFYNEHFSIVKSKQNITLDYDGADHIGSMIQLADCENSLSWVFLSEGIFIVFNENEPYRNVIYLK